MKYQAGYLTQQSGSWLGHYSKWVTDFRTGERKRQQRAFKIGRVADLSKTEARTRLQERVASEIGVTADSRATVAWFVEHRWKPMREGEWRDSTKQTNEELLKIILDRFGSKALEDMDGVEMQQWLNALAKDRSGSVVKHLRIFLMAICREAMEQEHMKKNPARLLRIPKLKAVKRGYLSEDEINKLLRATKWQMRDHVLLPLMIMTGLRPSELFALRWRSLSDDMTLLTITETVYRGQLRKYSKTTEEGDTEFITQYVPSMVANMLAEWHETTKYSGNEDFIFPNSIGGFITKENYQRRVLYPLADLAGIKRFNFQMLRRSVATHMQKLGSAKDIAAVLRHRKTDTAQANYVMTIEASVKQAVDRLAVNLLGSAN
jgi:integrase